MVISPDRIAAGQMQDAALPTRFVIISGYHDYRTKRRANLHFIADELVKRGSVFFLSIRFSELTRFGEDPRHDLHDHANRVERVHGIKCFLWRTPIHAFRLPRRLRLAERALFGLFAERLPLPAREAIAEAQMIFIESGIALIHVPLLRRINPRAKIVYLASDSLDAIGQAETIKQAFRDHAPLIDSARLPSPHLCSDVPDTISCYFVPHGIDKAQFGAIGSSPYRSGSRNAISVGSMLFDADFFRLAGERFPNVTFHVIGAGRRHATIANVVYLDEMPFSKTLPFIKHADFAIAAYGVGVAPYLEHTSMKLMQYAYLGIPAVCPDVVAGHQPGRFGYRQGDPVLIEAAIRAALATGDIPPRPQLGWDEVAARWIDPTAFADTRVERDARPMHVART